MARFRGLAAESALQRRVQRPRLGVADPDAGVRRRFTPVPYPTGQRWPLRLRAAPRLEPGSEQQVGFVVVFVVAVLFFVVQVLGVAVPEAGVAIRLLQATSETTHQ